MLPSSRDALGEDDPFLVQSQGIPLTSRDRQEGYDMDLIHAQPRGLPLPPTPSDQLPLSNPDHDDHDDHDPATTPYPPYFGHPAYDGLAGAAGAATHGESGGGRVGVGTTQFGGGAYGARDEKYAARPTSGAYEEPPLERKPKWYLRPLALFAIALVVVVIALAVGLGVGLSKRHTTATLVATATSSSVKSSSHSSQASATATPISSGAISSINLPSPVTHTSHTSSLSSAIPIPSTGTSIGETNGAFSSAADASSDSPSSTTVTTEILVSSASITVASTGNIPIAASIATTISGTVYSSLSVARR